MRGDRTEHFVLSPDHLALVRKMRVQWDDCEAGAPAVDPKMPYGNSRVHEDVAEILGWQAGTADGWWETDEGAEMSEAAMEIHRETEVALQLVLRFGPAPGVFRRPNPWTPWERA